MNYIYYKKDMEHIQFKTKDGIPLRCSRITCRNNKANEYLS